jgi:hypothetical protein
MKRETLKPTPITQAFEKWWGKNHPEANTLLNATIKDAVEKGFFAGYEAASLNNIK